MLTKHEKSLRQYLEKINNYGFPVPEPDTTLITGKLRSDTAPFLTNVLFQQSELLGEFTGHSTGLIWYK